MKTISLSKNERVIAVVPERCSGPGWSNQLANVHIVDYATNAHRVVHLQPQEMPASLMGAFGLLEHAHLYAVNTIKTARKRV